MGMVVYCPKCGDITCRSQMPAYCSYCKEELIVTNCTDDEYFDDIFNGGKLEKKIFEEYVKNSSEFDEELYDKREEEEHKSIIYSGGAPVPSRKDILKCPKCGSTAVSTGARGFSVVTGFLGSGQTVNRCGNCGHKWKPRG